MECGLPEGIYPASEDKGICVAGGRTRTPEFPAALTSRIRPFWRDGIGNQPVFTCPLEPRCARPTPIARSFRETAPNRVHVDVIDHVR